jgi:hypothetical protein
MHGVNKKFLVIPLRVAVQTLALDVACHIVQLG